jgi:hypothetical protein
MNFTKAERISLKLHPELNEKWVQELIASDPKILGLGGLVLRDKERIQPRAFHFPKSVRRAGATGKSPSFCSIGAPSFRPDLPCPTRSSERRSRMAVGHRVSGA